MSEMNPLLKTPQSWRNNKNGNIYFVHGVITNATNAVDGQLVVLYEEPNSGLQFVREHTEFMDKFTPLKDDPQVTSGGTHP
jgi:hypothetical protein